MLATTLALVVTFMLQSATAALISSPPTSRRTPGASHLGCRTTASQVNCAPMRCRGLLMKALEPSPVLVQGASSSDQDTIKAKPPTKKPHLQPGPVLFSWATGLLTLTLQATLTDPTLLREDAAALFGALDNPMAQLAAFYAFIWTVSTSFSVILMRPTFPRMYNEAADGEERTPMEVPHRTKNMKQHELGPIDYSYIALNSLCMPGLFYHYICLMRDWGLDFGAPPMFGIYPTNPITLLTETAPTGACALALYFFVYEFLYYWLHRAYHEVPALYTYVHKHHHQTLYPDRPIIDTLNTGCLESQLGLYTQLGVMWGCSHFLGVTHLAAGIWFFTIAGYLSVLEHDRFERSLPFNLFRTDEHHMHHAFVRCNYSPYTTVFDRMFGTFKPFAVAGAKAETPSSPPLTVPSAQSAVPLTEAVPVVVRPPEMESMASLNANTTTTL